MKPKALVLLASGTNRDRDVAEALSLAGGDPEIVPLNVLKADRKKWREFQILVLAGGFSYGDALGAGKLLAIDMWAYFRDEILDFSCNRKPVIGICNGFQALLKSGILPGGINLPGNGPKADDISIEATLTHNTSGHFECRWVTLRPLSRKCLWTKGLTDLIECPVAHAQGNFQVSNPELLAGLSSQDQIALIYCDQSGEPAAAEFPLNPNGSCLDIAGICNAAGNVLGLMPHPENHIHAFQNPGWTRRLTGRTGLALFENGVKYAEAG